MGAHELLRLTPRLRRAVVDRASDDEIRRIARDEGFVTLYKDGLRKASRGLTTPEEVRRIVPPDEDEESEALGPSRASLAPRGPRPPGAPERILLVDDDPIILRLLTAVLGEGGYSVIEAADGHVALSQLYNAPPDLILTDLNMPAMDGAGLIRRLRGDLALSQIPVLLMTSDAIGEAAARDLGADGLVQKPIDRTALTETIRAALVKATLAKATLARSVAAPDSALLARAPVVPPDAS